jgi:SAM-dependent methyltransferase
MQVKPIADGETFLREYTSTQAVRKYTRATAGFGISYLLDHGYKEIYLNAVDLLSMNAKRNGIRVLEFGCGGGMNLLHLSSVFSRVGIKVATLIGSDFSPVLIEAAEREARTDVAGAVTFVVANNDTLLRDLTAALNKKESELAGSFDLVFGVNTIRYSHRSGRQFDCARNLFDLLVPGGVCVVIDMNDRFPVFRSALRNRLARQKKSKEECYLPSLNQYAEPFRKAGFHILRKEQFCWIPHSGSRFITGVMRSATPILDLLAKSRAMRSLVISRKPISP